MLYGQLLYFCFSSAVGITVGGAIPVPATLRVQSFVDVMLPQLWRNLASSRPYQRRGDNAGAGRNSSSKRGRS